MFSELTLASTLFLFLAIGLALAFEFVNGFHDTANAVATVIYTKSLKPTPAVVWSGICNLLGVLTSSGAVAFGVVALLPAELVLNVGPGAGFAMVFALLVSSMIWNLGTWFLGLPASSSHTLIGSIIGVGLANSAMASGRALGEGVNWGNARDVGLSLLISPAVGFCAGALHLLVAKLFLKNPALDEAPKGVPPPLWIRSLLILTCTGVSFAHGSNDGQKGMGLVMLILIGILPATYALNSGAVAADHQLVIQMTEAADAVFQRHLSDPETGATFAELSARSRAIAFSLRQPAAMNVRTVRTDIYLASRNMKQLLQHGQLAESERETITGYQRELNALVNYIPAWVKSAIALALGLGTMIGWKRIVVTVGEKIGKAHLSYAQGA